MSTQPSVQYETKNTVDFGLEPLESKGKARDWCFTIHDLGWISTIQKWIAEKSGPPELDYIISNYEICPKTRKPHLQGYLELKTGPTTIKNTKRILGCEGAHLEKREARGDKGRALARHYCMKPVKDCKCKHCFGLTKPWREETPTWLEFGEYKEEKAPEGKQGLRTDLLSLRLAVTLGATDHALMYESEEYLTTLCRYPKFLPKLREVYAAKQASEIKYEAKRVIVFEGKSRSGKSSSAIAMAEELGYKTYELQRPTGGGNVWWDGYEGQEHVIVNEMSGAYGLEDMKKLLDAYPYKAQVKGGTVIVTAKLVTMTTNIKIEEWWPKYYEMGLVEPIFNRITERIYIDPLGVWFNIPMEKKLVVPRILKLAEISSLPTMVAAAIPSTKVLNLSGLVLKKIEPEKVSNSIPYPVSPGWGYMGEEKRG